MYTPLYCGWSFLFLNFKNTRESIYCPKWFWYQFETNAFVNLLDLGIVGISGTEAHGFMRLIFSFLSLLLMLNVAMVPVRNRWKKTWVFIAFISNYCFLSLMGLECFVFELTCQKGQTEIIPLLFNSSIAIVLLYLYIMDRLTLHLMPCIHSLSGHGWNSRRNIAFLGSVTLCFRTCGGAERGIQDCAVWAFMGCSAHTVLCYVVWN